MSAVLYPGIKAVHLVLTRPYDSIRTTDIRDDLLGVKVWFSTTSGFDPAQGQGALYSEANSLLTTINGLDENKDYYVRYAFISKIDPETYTISSQLTAKTIGAGVQVYGYLTNDPVGISTDSSGVISVNGTTTPTVQQQAAAWQTVTGGVFKVYNNSEDVTDKASALLGPVYSIKSNSYSGGLVQGNVVINAATGEYYTTNLTSDNGSVIFQAVYNGVTIEIVWSVYKGKAGQLAPILRLSSTGKEFVYKNVITIAGKTTSYNVDPATIKITANLTNLTGEAVFHTKAFSRGYYDGSGTYIPSIELGTGNVQILFTQTGNTIEMTSTQFSDPIQYAVDVGFVLVTATIGTVSDSMSIYRIVDGTDNIVVEQSNPAHLISAAQNGDTTPENYNGSGNIIQVKRGITTLSVDNSSPYPANTWRVVTIDSSNITCDTSPEVGTDFIRYDPMASMTADDAYIDYTVRIQLTSSDTTNKYQDYKVRQSFAKSKQGTQGTQGTRGTAGVAGTSAGSLVLQDSIVLVGPSSGYAGIDFSAAAVQLTAYIGSIKLTGTETPQAQGLTYSCTVNAAGVSGVAVLYNDINSTLSLSAPTQVNYDPAYVDVTAQLRDAAGAVHSTITRRVVYTVARSVPKFVTISAFKWGTSVGTFTQAFTYTWETRAVSAYPSGWSASAGASTATGQTLYQINLTITDTGAALTTAANWSNAVSSSIGFREDGSVGPTGASARRAYIVNTSDTAPASPTAATGDKAPTSWSFTATSTLTAGQYMYQVDGTLSGQSGNITWGNPYLSNLKVGSLSAISANLGTVGISTVGSLSTTGKTYGSATSGIFLGYDSNAYKMQVGSNTNGMTWDGSNFAVTGGTVTGSVINTAASGVRATLTGSGLTVYGDGTNVTLTVNASGIFCSKPTGSIASAITGETAGALYTSAVSGSSSSGATGVYGTNTSTGYAGQFIGTNCLYLSGSVTTAALAGVAGVWLTNAILPIVDNTYVLGYADNRWSSIWSANGVVQTSDIRTKRDIVECDLGLDFISKLRPVSYKFISGGNKVIPQPDIINEYGISIKQDPLIEETPGQRTHYGLIAQEVKAVLGDKDAGLWVLSDINNPQSMQAMRYEELIAPMIKAIQELQAEIQQLKKGN